MNAGNCIQTARIADIGQALRHDTNQEISVIADVHISLCMGDELRLAAALRHQEAEGNHLALLQIQTGARVK